MNWDEQILQVLTFDPIVDSICQSNDGVFFFCFWEERVAVGWSLVPFILYQFNLILILNFWWKQFKIDSLKRMKANSMLLSWNPWIDKLFQVLCSLMLLANRWRNCEPINTTLKKTASTFNQSRTELSYVKSMAVWNRSLISTSWN